MAFLCIADVLENIRRFHSALAAVFESNRTQADDERRRQILEVLRRQERSLAEDLQRIEQLADDSVGATWLQFDPEPELWKSAEAELDGVLDESPRRLLELAIEIDRTLLSVYERIASALLPPRVRELFTDLAELQRSRIRRRALQRLDPDT